MVGFFGVWNGPALSSVKPMPQAAWFLALEQCELQQKKYVIRAVNMLNLDPHFPLRAKKLGRIFKILLQPLEEQFNSARACSDQR